MSGALRIDLQHTARHRPYLVVLIALTVLVSSAVVLLPRHEAKAATTYKVWHFNMCGNKCFDGKTTVVQSIYDSITKVGDKQDFVGLNEVCRNQFDALMAKLPSTWSGEFVRTLHHDNYSGLCNRGGAQVEYNYGNAVFFRAPRMNGSLDTLQLSDGDGGAEDSDPGSIKEHRKLICLTADLPSNIRLCTVHIAHLATWTNRGDTSSEAMVKQAQQIREVANRVNSYGRPVILTGDFNTEPEKFDGCGCSDGLDALYDQGRYGMGASGKFREIDEDSPGKYPWDPPCRCGINTSPNPSPAIRKIDYIFFTHSDFTWDESGSVTNPVQDSDGDQSDHKILRGRVNI